MGAGEERGLLVEVRLGLLALDGGAEQVQLLLRFGYRVVCLRGETDIKGSAD